MEALEYCAFQTMANPVEICCFCTSSTCGVSSEYLNYEKHSVVRLLYQSHVYYHMGQVPKRLHIPLSHKAGFNPFDNPYSNEELCKLCEDYNIPAVSG